MLLALGFMRNGDFEAARKIFGITLVLVLLDIPISQPKDSLEGYFFGF